MKYAALVKAIHSANSQLQGRAAMAVNQALVLRNWLVGSWILEFEQHGQDRAKYGERLLESLAKDLSISGLEIRNLQNCRLLYAAYPQIRQTLSAEFPNIPVFGGHRPPNTGEADNANYRDFGNTADSVCRMSYSASA